jgi:hypothetical protein
LTLRVTGSFGGNGARRTDYILLLLARKDMHSCQNFLPVPHRVSTMTTVTEERSKRQAGVDLVEWKEVGGVIHVTSLVLHVHSIVNKSKFYNPSNYS